MTDFQMVEAIRHLENTEGKLTKKACTIFKEKTVSMSLSPQI
jgi:hypothetical protein